MVQYFEINSLFYIIKYYSMKQKKQRDNPRKEKILNQIPIFLAKTYRIVDNPDYSDTIQWIPEGNGFVVKDITDLTEKIFPKHFKHSKYASFVRQLNLYGFHKVRSSDQGQIFTHEYFQKTNPQLLLLIKRRNAPPESQKIQKSTSQLALVSPPPPSSLMLVSNSQPTNSHLQKQLGMLTQKHQSLQNLVSVLVEQNKQIILQNKNFINKINNMDDGYRKKLETLIFLMVFGLKNGDGNSNIIVPPQLHNMIKAFTSGKKDKKSKNGNNLNGSSNDGSSQAMQLFKKPAQDQSRFNNKKIEQILQMLKMQSEGENSEIDQQKQDNQHLELGNQNGDKKSISHLNEQSFMNDLNHPPSPIASLRSLSSRYMDGRLNDDWNDFLDKLEHSDVELENRE